MNIKEIEDTSWIVANQQNKLKVIDLLNEKYVKHPRMF